MRFWNLSFRELVGILPTGKFWAALSPKTLRFQASKDLAGKFLSRDVVSALIDCGYPIFQHATGMLEKGNFDFSAKPKPCHGQGHQICATVCFEVKIHRKLRTDLFGCGGRRYCNG
ncbi:MAG: hypothetical protein IJX94_03855 [Clostridia bacterium]|nr:hypothetical protein [Clostridia bacterium]